jgi:hypothetical protein
MGSCAFEDAAGSPDEPSIARLSSLASREAADSPAPLHDSRRHLSTSNAVSHCSMKYTARANVRATIVQVLPWPGLRSRQARDFCPAGLFRKTRPAASEKAHLRSALPIFLPEVPERLPAESFAHVTSRP